MRNSGAAPDPSSQFSLFRLYIIEHPTFHSAQDDEMRRGVLIALRAHRHFERSRGSLLQNVHRLMWDSTRTSFSLGAYTLIPAVQ